MTRLRPDQPMPIMKADAGHPDRTFEYPYIDRKVLFAVHREERKSPFQHLIAVAGMEEEDIIEAIEAWCQAKRIKAERAEVAQIFHGNGYFEETAITRAEDELTPGQRLKAVNRELYYMKQQVARAERDLKDAKIGWDIEVTELRERIKGDRIIMDDIGLKLARLRAKLRVSQPKKKAVRRAPRK